MALREHLLTAQRRTGEVHPMLADGPRPPAGCGPLWRDFMELHNSRSWGEGGPKPISFVELDAWQRVRGVRLAAWEIAAVRAADAGFLGVHARARKVKK